MPLIYGFVARGTTVLADYTAYTGNFSVIAVQALEKGSQGSNAKFTYSCDGHSTYRIHYRKYIAAARRARTAVFPPHTARIPQRPSRSWSRSPSPSPLAPSPVPDTRSR